MTTPPEGDPYELDVAGPVSRVIRETLPEGVAFAVIDFINGPLIQNPQRVGHGLTNELAGLHSAHVGDYRVLYRIDEESRAVRVVRVSRRADVYGID